MLEDGQNSLNLSFVAVGPFTVFFGLLSGHIRYLYKTSRLLIDDELNRENDKTEMNLTKEDLLNIEITRRILFFQSLKGISLFFLNPLLAILVWFLFSQWQPISHSSLVLATFSFASGLTTTEIINAVKK